MPLNTRTEKRRFIRELCQNVQCDLVAQVAKIPRDWDGWELRWLIADRFESAGFGRRVDRYRIWKEQRRRYQRYRNECLIRNLW